MHSVTMDVLRNANSIAFFSKAKRCRKKLSCYLKKWRKSHSIESETHNNKYAFEFQCDFLFIPSIHPYVYMRYEQTMENGPPNWYTWMLPLWQTKIKHCASIGLLPLSMNCLETTLSHDNTPSIFVCLCVFAHSLVRMRSRILVFLSNLIRSKFHFQWNRQ